VNGRCIQCGYSVPERKLDDAWRDGERVPLPKGGCPRPDVLAKKGDAMISAGPFSRSKRVYIE
jgi:hypothetical protein